MRLITLNVSITILFSTFRATPISNFESGLSLLKYHNTAGAGLDLRHSGDGGDGKTVQFSLHH